MRADTLTAGNNHPNLAAAAGWWLYEHAPAPLDSLLRFGRRHLAPLLHPRLDLRSYHLADASSGQIVAAGDGMTLGFLLQRFGRMSAAAPCPTGLASLSAALRRAAAEGDLVLAMVPRAIGRRIGRGFLRAPALVSLALEVKHDLEATLAQATTTVRRDARRVVEMGVTWTVSHALSELDQFYDHYYAPSVRQRFGELAVVRQRSMLRRQFRHGGALIWLEQGGRRIGGSVVQVRCGTLHGLVAAADPRLQHEGRAGPQFAGKIASLVLASRLGAARVDLGGTVPCLRDGVMQAKRAFGASLCEFADNHRDLLLAWRPGAPAVRQLLHEAPLLFGTGSSFDAVAAAPPGTEASAALAVQLWRQYAPRGLRRLYLLGAGANGRLQPDGRVGDGPITLWPDTGAADLADAAAREDPPA